MNYLSYLLETRKIVNDTTKIQANCFRWANIIFQKKVISFLPEENFNEDFNTLSCIPFLTRNIHGLEGIEYRDSLRIGKANPLFGTRPFHPGDCRDSSLCSLLAMTRGASWSALGSV